MGWRREARVVGRELAFIKGPMILNLGLQGQPEMGALAFW